MKTTKKIIAAILAVMMLALMIPMTASAADPEYSFKFNGPKTGGYTFTLYKLADLDLDNGKYTVASSLADNAELVKAINEGNSQSLLTEADKLATDSISSLKVGASFKIAEANGSYNGTVNVPGIYYVRATSYPDKVNTTKIGGSIFSLPYYDDDNDTWANNVTVNIASKIEDDQPSVSKKFSDTDKADKTSISELIGNNVNFTLTGDVIGSAEQKLVKYEFADQMSKGLTMDVNSITVTLTGGQEGSETKSLVKDTDFTYSETGTEEDHNFTIALNKENVLDTADFYTYENVVVTYTAKLNSDAVIGGAGNPNHVDLVYRNSVNTSDSTLPGDTLTVYTFDLDVVKVDAANTETKLNGAGFTLYTDSDCKNVVTAADGTKIGAEKKTNSEGTATFTGLKAGDYFLKETTAPANYNINSTVFKITIADDGTVRGPEGSIVNDAVQVKDSKLVAPQTGGMGTAVFTICGASLVVLGGVLMLITLKKKKAAK